MSVTVSIEIKGLQKMADLLDKSPRVAEKEVRAALAKGVIVLQGAARQFTPVDTGRLRGGHKTRVGAFEAAVYNPVDYALYVHEGTRKMRARPFYKLAAEDSKDKINSIFDKHVANIIKQIT